jgi:tetratricopeptide (TPR) repeat protein
MATFISATFYFARQYEEAERQCQRALELEPNFPVTHWHLGLIYEQVGKYNQAILEHRKAVDLSGGSPTADCRTWPCICHCGQPGRSNASHHAIKSERLLIAPGIGSHFCGSRRKGARAFELLEEAYNERSFHITYIGVRPDFDAVRNDPRFAN